MADWRPLKRRDFIRKLQALGFQACKELKERLGNVKSPRGEKAALVEAAIEHQAGEFSVSDLQNECPGVGVDLIRRVLKRLRGWRSGCARTG